MSARQARNFVEPYLPNMQIPQGAIRATGSDGTESAAQATHGRLQPAPIMLADKMSMMIERPANGKEQANKMCLLATIVMKRHVLMGEAGLAQAENLMANLLKIRRLVSSRKS